MKRSTSIGIGPIGLTLCSLLLALALSMCSKQGPAGATGATGPQGPAGPKGAKGDTGTANVMYSKWDSAFSGTSAVWSVPAITQGILDSGTVLVYVDQNGYVYPLPYDNVNGSGFYINDLLRPGQISLYCASGYNLNQFKFRYVIIPGGVAVSDEQRGYQYITSRFMIEPIGLGKVGAPEDRGQLSTVLSRCCWRG